VPPSSASLRLPWLIVPGGHESCKEREKTPQAVSAMTKNFVARFPLGLSAILLAVSCHSPVAESYVREVSLDAFCDQVIVGLGTPRTHLFDAYTQGSYHIEPRELTNRLLSRSFKAGQIPIAAAVFGPYGPLWAFDVYLFHKDSDRIKVHFLTAAHARIVVKGIASNSPAEVQSFLEQFRKAAETSAHSAGTLKERVLLLVEPAANGSSSQSQDVSIAIEDRGLQDRLLAMLESLEREGVTTYARPMQMGR